MGGAIYLPLLYVNTVYKKIWEAKMHEQNTKPKHITAFGIVANAV